MASNKDIKKVVNTLIKNQGDALDCRGGEWEEDAVSSEIFFRDYLREPAYPRQQNFVNKILGRSGSDWDFTYDEAIGLLGKGAGKDRTVAKLMCYVCYKLLCMRSPQKFLGLNDTDASGPESAIDIANVSLNARLAQDVFFKNFKSMVRSCRNPKTGKNWFEEHGVSLDRDILQRSIKFPKGVTAYSLDSEEYTGEGLNILLAVFDEVGGFEPKKAEDLYRALVSTQKTRFGQNRKTILISYKRDDNDYMLIRYNQAEHEPRTYREKAATWDWNIKRKKEDFIDDYIRNPEESKRIYECEGSTAADGYFRYKQRIRESINPNHLNPIVGDVLWTDDLLAIRFKDFFKPIKGTKYYIHIDLAKGKLTGDYAGFGMAHAVKNQSVKLDDKYLRELEKAEGFTIVKGIDQKQTAVVVDLALQIRARAGTEIIFDEIRQFIQILSKMGFLIGMVGFDQFQSTDSQQILKQKGVKCEPLSVDKNTEAYDTLKEIMYKGLLDLYEHKFLVRELEELIRNNRGKVDHPEKSYRRSLDEGRFEGSKDISDGICGAASLAVKYGKNSFSFGTSVTTQRVKKDADGNDKLVCYGE